VQIGLGKKNPVATKAAVSDAAAIKIADARAKRTSVNLVRWARAALFSSSEDI